jgi:hypothetical protein
MQAVRYRSVYDLGVLLPKLNFYFNNGIGTHSNDARVVLANKVDETFYPARLIPT